MTQVTTPLPVLSGHRPARPGGIVGPRPGRVK
jgi:hypothetical protein